MHHSVRCNRTKQFPVCELLKIIGVTLSVCVALVAIKTEYSGMLLQNATYGMPALIQKGKVDNLFIGSSMFRQGLDIDTLCENVGVDTYILAYNGNQPVLEYIELKYLLDNGVKIENLYIDMYVYSAVADPDVSDEKLFMEVGAKEKWELWKQTKKNTISTDTEALWRIFVNGNNELILTWPFTGPLIDKQFKQGGTLTRTGGATKEQLEEWIEPDITKLNEEQISAIEAIIELAQQNDIRVVFLETPKYEKIAKSENYLQLMKEYYEIICDENVDIVLCDATAAGIKTVANCMIYQFDNMLEEYFMDAIHLSSKGRSEYSKLLKGSV